MTKRTPIISRRNAPAGPASSFATAKGVFAVAALLFGSGLLCLWRFGPSDGDAASVTLVLALLAMFFGGMTGAQELNLLGDSDGSGCGDGDGDGGGD